MQFIKDIPGSDTFLEVTEIKRGWSVDRKFHIKTQTTPLLLRVAPLDYLEKRMQEFEILQTLAVLDINCSKPIRFGKLSEHAICYSILTWVEGTDASEILPKLPVDEQYALGLRAGSAFAKIQRTVPIPDNLPDWKKKFSAKVERNIGLFLDSKIELTNADAIITYLQTNKHLLQGRPQSFHHGDFHVGNLVINADYELGIIDFNRWDFGDPWEEFNRIIWSVKVSTPFTNGLLHGYFENNIPQQFWPLLKYYLLATLIGSLYWAMPFGENDVDTAIENIELVDAWFTTTDIPYWYTKEQY